MPLKTVRSIEIEQFVAATRHEEHEFVKQAYYIEPDRVGRKAFSLLRAVLQEKGLTAICKVVIRDREALAALDPFENTMVLSTLTGRTRSAPPGAGPARGGLRLQARREKMAEQLVEAMTGEFDPAQYRDEYREALSRSSSRRSRAARAGVEVAPSAKLVDLMAPPGSVNAGDRGEGQGRPVSVAEAKEKAQPKKRQAAGRRRPSRKRRGRSGPPAGARARSGDHGHVAPHDDDAVVVAVTRL